MTAKQMELGQLKTQIMTMFMMKSATTKPGESGAQDIYNILYSMLMINLIEWLFRQVPVATEYVKKYLNEKYGKRTDVWKPLIDAHKNEKLTVHSITMTRAYKEGEKPSDRIDNVVVEKVDAVLDYICNLDGAKHVRMDVRLSLNNTDEIELTPLLKAKVKQSGSEADSLTEVILFSTTMKISDIRAWVDEIHSNYVAEKNNKLGNKAFYFNEVVYEPVTITDMSGKDGPRQLYRWDNMPKMLTFNMNEFKTSKSFSNVYGHHVDELKERLDLFVSHPEWYMDRGIPYSLGILLHGIPGAGKTSTIKAIAKDTNRHIFNLSLRPYTTQRQLTNLFFNETVAIQTYDGGKQTLKIPLNKRVYVIEDIDCLTDVVLDRSITKESAANKEGEAITLSFLLNLLDGVLETPGRILVISSNYPDKLDKALVRPGRIDVRIEFKNANREFVLDMVNKFYETKMTLDTIPVEIDGAFTPAEVMESLCTNYKTPSAALVHLVKKLAKKKEKEEEMASGTRLEELGLTVETVAPTEETAQMATVERSPTPLPTNNEPPTLLIEEEGAEVAKVEEKPPKAEETPPKKDDTPIAHKNASRCAMCEAWYDSNDPTSQEEHRFGMCLRKPPTKNLPPPEMGLLPKPNTWRCYGATWECPFDHPERESKHCKICGPKRTAAENQYVMKMTASMGGGGLANNPTEDAWGTAMFQDAVIPEGAGGWMPGMPREGDERSTVDLNQLPRGGADN